MMRVEIPIDHETNEIIKTIKAIDNYTMIRNDDYNECSHSKMISNLMCINQII